MHGPPAVALVVPVTLGEGVGRVADGHVVGIAQRDVGAAVAVLGLPAVHGIAIWLGLGLGLGSVFQECMTAIWARRVTTRGGEGSRVKGGQAYFGRGAMGVAVWSGCHPLGRMAMGVAVWGAMGAPGSE